jgi:hypothetical protein
MKVWASDSDMIAQVIIEFHTPPKTRIELLVSLQGAQPAPIVESLNWHRSVIRLRLV